METLDLTKYKEIALRRLYWIIIPFMLTLLAGQYYILKTPRIYEASTLILVQAQKVPENYVQSIVSSEIDDRLRTITEQVTSRTNLEQIIQEYQLYTSPSEKDILLEEKVALLRKNLVINVASQSQSRTGSGANAFTIAFQGSDPQKVAQVTNALASNFISENLKIRESQALGTSDFLKDELESIRKQLMAKEEELKSYKEKYMGGLPEQLDTNLRILERLQGELEQLNSSLGSAEDRRIILQQNIEAAIQTGQQALTGEARGVQGLEALRNELASLQTKYTDKHPDIIDLKRRIAALEAAQQETEASATGNSTGETQAPRQIVVGNQALRVQLEDVKVEIARLKADIEQTKSQINWYAAKVEETPKREQEQLSLTRDYNNLRDLYNSMLNRKLEAEVAVSMEKKQKGEQFKVIDPATAPHRPVKPDIPRLFLMTIALGLGLGLGMAYLMELMDTSYRTPDDLEKDLGLPVIVSMPIIYTEQEARNKKRNRVLVAASVIGCFFLCVVGIVLAVKGLDSTVSYLKAILEKI
jgi:polysaccharide chain length determinant protein (PEP-CTERM system associated)